MKAILLRFVVAVLTFIIGLVLAKLAALFGLDDGNAKKVWASPNAAFEVRLTANLETGEYRFQSTTRDSNSRQDFLIFQLDDYAFISQEQAGFAEDSKRIFTDTGKPAKAVD
ncbi:MAG: hypothetical protein L0229_06460 [Blastocatellia bacterium]|nr:hypothetical protein [Blastocatellia bacterium]